MTAPVGLFLLVAYLPGDLGTINLFEEGQILAGAEIVRDGAFPWRDILVVHGLLHDIGTGLFGSAVIEDSRWGVVAGEKLLILPLSWVALYYLCAYLFWSNWLFLLGTQLLVVTGSIFVVHYRLGLIPLVLLLLAALFHRPTVTRAVAFTSLLFVQLIVTPEAIWAAPMYVLVIVLFELSYRDTARRFAENFRRTLLIVASAGVLGLAWSFFLLANDAFDDFVFSYRAFIPGHQLTGGVPLGTYLRGSAPGERRRALRGVCDPRSGRTHPRSTSLLHRPHPSAALTRGLRLGDARGGGIRSSVLRQVSQPDRPRLPLVRDGRAGAALRLLSCHHVRGEEARDRYEVARRIVVSDEARDHAPGPARSRS